MYECVVWIKLTCSADRTEMQRRKQSKQASATVDMRGRACCHYRGIIVSVWTASTLITLPYRHRYDYALAIQLQLYSIQPQQQLGCDCANRRRWRGNNCTVQRTRIVHTSRLLVRGVQHYKQEAWRLPTMCVAGSKHIAPGCSIDRFPYSLPATETTLPPSDCERIFAALQPQNICHYFSFWKTKAAVCLCVAFRLKSSQTRVY